MENDVQPAAEFLRRMAPTQTHENRRNFQLAAKHLEGAKLGPYPASGIYYEIPVFWEGEVVGYASFSVMMEDADHDPVVTARYSAMEDSGAFEDDEADNPVTNPNGHPDKGGSQEQPDDDDEVSGERRTDPHGFIQVKLEDMSDDNFTTICTPAGANEHTIPTKEWLLWSLTKKEDIA